MTRNDFYAAHQHSSEHREEILAGDRCGCFYCQQFFEPSEISEWIDQGQTAICPRCGIDSVIGSKSGYPITPRFMAAMEERWFGCATRDGTFDAAVEQVPYPFVFLTISGAHLYGFPSADSDYDLRGAHILPINEVIGLDAGRETIEVSVEREGLEIDLVTHDVKKFFAMMLKRNGYVLEQLFSPLHVRVTPQLEELRKIAGDCITRHHAHHYLGFARTQWELFDKDRRAKPLLYVYRVLLTGIHLMRTGEVEANLQQLNRQFKLSFIDELITRKIEGAEKEPLPDADIDFHRREYGRLTAELEQARHKSELPDEPTARAALNDLLIRLRTNGVSG